MDDSGLTSLMGWCVASIDDPCPRPGTAAAAVEEEAEEVEVEVEKAIECSLMDGEKCRVMSMLRLRFLPSRL